jgi:hypothetical protein
MEAQLTLALSQKATKKFLERYSEYMVRVRRIRLVSTLEAGDCWIMP